MSAPELEPTDFRRNSAPEGGDPERTLSAFARSLRLEVDALDAPDFEELARAVDGDLDPSERALWQERLAHEPELARRAAELERFRSEIDQGAVLLPFRRRPAKIALSGWLAAAAVLLFVVAVRELAEQRPESRSPRAAAPSSQQGAPEQLFADGFEAGDASSWTSATPSG